MSWLFRFFVPALLILALGACDNGNNKKAKSPPPSAPTELDLAANQVLDLFLSGKLPMGNDAFGAPAAVFGKHTVPAVPSINAPAYTMEYTITMDSIDKWMSLKIAVRYSNGAGSYVGISRLKTETKWAVNGVGNMPWTSGANWNEPGSPDYPRYKAFLMEAFDAARACGYNNTKC